MAIAKDGAAALSSNTEQSRFDQAAMPPAVAEEMRRRFHEALGQDLLLLASAPRYRHLALGEIEAFVIEPLLRDRLSIATGKALKGEQDHMPIVAGLAIWASVSDDADARIREQIKAGVFPVRLKPGDWTSGDKVWLLDLVAPSRELASAVLANLRQVLGEGEASLHPIAAQQVDPELLKALRTSPGRVAR